MKIRELLFFAAMIIMLQPISVEAQLNFGIKGGASVPNLSSDSDNIFTQEFGSIAAFGFGLFLEVPLSSSFSFQPELLFAVKGGQRNGLQPIPDTRVPGALAAFLPSGLVPYAVFDNKSILNYLEIPLLLKYSTQGRKGISVFGGPYIGFIVGAKAKIRGNSVIFLDPGGSQGLALPGSTTPVELPFDQDVNIEDEIASSNFGVQGGIDLFTHSGDTKIFLQGAFSLGFTTIQREIRFGESQVGSVTFSLGFSQPL